MTDERQLRYRNRQHERGRRLLTAWAPVEVIERLDTIKEQRGCNRADVLSAAISALDERLKSEH